MATHFDDFGGATPGSTPTGWTLRNRDGAGDIWAMNAFDDSGNIVARLDNLSGDDNLTFITYDAVGSISGACEVLAKWRIQTGEAINQKSSLVWIYANTAATAGYAAMWRSTEFRIVQLSGGGENSFVGSAYTGFSPAVNTWYWTRFGVDGSGNFYAKFWADGGAEPGTNNITGTDTAITSGFMGVGGMTYTALSDFDLVGLATGGDAAPSSAGAGGNANLFVGKLGHPFRGKLG